MVDIALKVNVLSINNRLSPSTVPFVLSALIAFTIPKGIISLYFHIAADLYVSTDFAGTYIVSISLKGSFSNAGGTDAIHTTFPIDIVPQLIVLAESPMINVLSFVIYVFLISLLL